MYTDTNERPGIEERLLTACTSSDMTLALDRRSPADIHIAAGLAGKNNQLGMALVHLESEWHRCDKPPKWTAEAIEKRSRQLKDKKGRPDVKRATVEALVWHAGAMRERAMKLTGRSVVIGLLKDFALMRGIDVDLISPALFHWLAPSCPACAGLGKVKAIDAPSLTDKKCPHGQGAGTWPRPLGAQAIHDHIKSCLGAAKGGTAQKMRD